MTSFPNHLQTLPPNYMMKAFGSDSQLTTKTLTFVATVAAAYFSFQYLPPGIDRWVGGIVLLTGTTFLLFGSCSNVLKFISDFFSHSPGPSPRHIPSKSFWNYPVPPIVLQHSIGGYHNSPYKPHYVGSYTTRSSYRPYSSGPYGSGMNYKPSLHSRHMPPYFESKQHQHTSSFSRGNYSGTLHPTSYLSGTRGKGKGTYREDEYHDTSHLEHKQHSPHGLHQFCHPHTTLHGNTQLDLGFGSSGTRAKKKDP